MGLRESKQILDQEIAELQKQLRIKESQLPTLNSQQLFVVDSVKFCLDQYPGKATLFYDEGSQENLARFSFGSFDKEDEVYVRILPSDDGSSTLTASALEAVYNAMKLFLEHQ
jgi:hypothetical protein